MLRRQLKLSVIMRCEHQVDIMDRITHELERTRLHDITWHWHVDEYDYSFTTDIKLATGYPVKDNGSDKVVLVVGENGVTDLTEEDKIVAKRYGFELGVA